MVTCRERNCWPSGKQKKRTSSHSSKKRLLANRQGGTGWSSVEQETGVIRRGKKLWSFHLCQSATLSIRFAPSSFSRVAAFHDASVLRTVARQSDSQIIVSFVWRYCYEYAFAIDDGSPKEKMVYHSDSYLMLFLRTRPKRCAKQFVASFGHGKQMHRLIAYMHQPPSDPTPHCHGPRYACNFAGFHHSSHATSQEKVVRDSQCLYQVESFLLPCICT